MPENSMMNICLLKHKIQIEKEQIKLLNKKHF